MDDSVARQFCRNELRRRGNPPEIDLEDLVQDYLLAELEGKKPKECVVATLRESCRHSRKVDSCAKMHLHPAKTYEVGESDEARDTFEEIERDITEEVRLGYWAKVESALRQLPDYVPAELDAIRWRYGLDCQPMQLKAISRELRASVPRVKNLIKEGLQRIRSLAIGREVYLALFDVMDEVHDVKEAYKRGKGRFQRQEDESVILGEV